MENKMNVASKIGVGVVVVAVAGIGSVYFLAKSTSDAIEAEINNNINVAQSLLGADVKIERLENNSGLFETSGKVKISRETKDKNLSGGLVVNYEIEHGIMTAFGGAANVKGSITPDGEIVKTLQLKADNGVTQTFEGIIKDGQELELNVKHSNISLVLPESLLTDGGNTKDGMTIKASGENDTIKYSAKTKDLVAEYSGLNISLEDANKPIDKLILKNISGSHKFNIDKVVNSGLYQGQSSFGFEQLDNGTDQFKVSNFKLDTDATINGDKYNFVSKIKVGSFTGLGQSNLTGQLNTSLLNINKEVVTTTKELISTISKNANLSDEFLNKYKAVVVKGVEQGLTASIDTLKVKSDDVDFDGAAAIKILAASPDAKFSLYKNASLDVRATIKGNLAQTSSAVIGGALGLDIPDPSNPINEFKLSVAYSDGVVKVNEVTAKPDVAVIIEDGLKSADSLMGYTVEEIKPETVQEETIKVSNESNPETNVAKPEQVSSEISDNNNKDKPIEAETKTEVAKEKN